LVALRSLRKTLLNFNCDSHFDGTLQPPKAITPVVVSDQSARFNNISKILSRIFLTNHTSEGQGAFEELAALSVFLKQQTKKSRGHGSSPALQKIFASLLPSAMRIAPARNSTKQ
jgi:hypothetical protein